MSTQNVSASTQASGAPEKMIVMVTSGGFIKKIPASVYRSQHQPAEGIIGMGRREPDALKFMVTADSQDKLLLFTNKGKVFRLGLYEIPTELSYLGKGQAINGLFHMLLGEKVAALVSVTSFKTDYYLLLATARGEIKKSGMENFAAVRSSGGAVAMDLEEDDELLAAVVAADQDEVILTTLFGQSLRFKAESLRSSSLTSGGVRGVRLEEGDIVVSLELVIPEAFLLVVTANGYGKLSPLSEYSPQGRGGLGIKAVQLTRKTGDVAVAKVVTSNQQLTLVSKAGQVITVPVKEDAGTGVRLQGRATQGVLIMDLAAGDLVTAAGVWE
jgi:DNA gyrase subunit A